MANQKLMKKVAPVVLSAAVAMTSMPATAFAADFSDTEVTVAEESADVEDASAEAADVDITEEAEVADVDVDEAEEDVTEDETSDEELFSAEVSEDEFADEAGEGQTEGEAYVLMNIPYDDFYKAELKNNDVKVDAFTSATLNKSRTAGMMNGNSAYHTDKEGTNLAGVTFPVKVSDINALKDQKKVTDDDTVTITVTNRGQTSEKTYTGKDSLIENASYSYYVLSETPRYYKELTVNSDGSFAFSDVKGAEEKTVKTTGVLTTESNYGDYQLDIDSTAFTAEINTSTDKIYGVTVNTTDDTEYGMRHLENIWRGYELAWCTGYTSAVHGCPTSSEHYKSMMGKTIDSVTYYTDKGIIIFDIDDVSVLIKTGVSAAVANIHTTDTEAAVTLDGNLPEGFSAKYAVDGTDVAYADGKIATGTLNAGSHTLVISDANGKYAPIQTSFYAKEANVPAVYDDAEHKLTAADGITADAFSAYIKTITSVTVGDKTYAASGRGATVIVTEDGTLDTSNLELAEDTKFVVTSSEYDDLEFTYSLYSYVYAGLTWAEYWAAEGVYNATNTTSVDSFDEHMDPGDKGGFDAVTRATTNHGLHRGSYQCTAIITGESGATYSVSSWEDNGKTLVLTDGTKVSYDGGTIGGTDKLVKYEVTGLKYVPVKVKAEDYKDFAEKYTVVKNGGTLSGGYSEKNLQAYSVVANVTANTNGLKEVTKNADGTFTFGARTSTGTESGIKDTELKEATDVTPTVKPANGGYGEFLRVDLTGNYGGLGAAMQAVKWEYYGNSDTVLATYGTKFAADNWMHKSNGIQLGLTNSVRCQLPSGTDGTGKWKITVYALGYKDYTYEFTATSDNIVTPVDASTLVTSALEKAISDADKLSENDYTKESWKKVADELEESKNMLITISSAKKANTTTNLYQSSIDEQIPHLTEAMENLVKATVTVSPATAELTVGGTTKLTAETNITDGVVWTSSDEKVATVSEDGTVTAKAVGTVTITATAGTKSATCTVTVKTAEQKVATPTPTVKPTATPTPVVTPGITAKVAQVYVGKKATIKVTKTKVTGTAKFTSSNKKVATVSKKGVITGKKAGKTVITVKVGKYTKKLTVTVKKPSFKLVKSSAKLKKGQKVTITSKAAPAAKVIYKTSNKKVATVNSKGVVTAKKKGTAKITVKCNGITRTFKVTVK